MILGLSVPAIIVVSDALNFNFLGVWSFVALEAASAATMAAVKAFKESSSMSRVLVGVPVALADLGFLGGMVVDFLCWGSKLYAHTCQYHVLPYCSITWSRMEGI